MHNLTQAKKLVPSISFNCLGFWIAAPSPFEISGFAPVIAKRFHGKRIRKFRKKLESEIHEAFLMFQRYSELTFCQRNKTSR